jgi:hypothetical protein
VALAVVPAALEILGLGHAAQFEGFHDVAADSFVDAIHPFLGIHETARHLIIQERFPSAFEFSDLGLVEGLAAVLSLVQVLALLGHRLVKLPGLVVGQEGIDIPPEFEEVRLADNGLAKLAGLLDHRAVSGNRMHGFCAQRPRKVAELKSGTSISSLPDAEVCRLLARPIGPARSASPEDEIAQYYCHPAPRSEVLAAQNGAGQGFFRCEARASSPA